VSFSLGDIPILGDAAAAGAPLAWIETNVLPPIPVYADLEGAGASSSWLMSLIRPRLRGGDLPFLGSLDLAPYGAPSAGAGTLVFYGVAALAVVGLISLTKGRG
jgi:hypothetical protein